MMMSLISLALFAAAMAAVIVVMAATLVPALPRINAILTTDGSPVTRHPATHHSVEPRRIRSETHLKMVSVRSTLRAAA